MRTPFDKQKKNNVYENSSLLTHAVKRHGQETNVRKRRYFEQSNKMYKQEKAKGLWVVTY